MSSWPLLGLVVLGLSLSVTGKTGVLQLDGGNFHRALRQHKELLVHFCELPRVLRWEPRAALPCVSVTQTPLGLDRGAEAGDRHSPVVRPGTCK